MSIGNSLLHRTDLYVELWKRGDLFKYIYTKWLLCCGVNKKWLMLWSVLEMLIQNYFKHKIIILISNGNALKYTQLRKEQCFLDFMHTNVTLTSLISYNEFLVCKYILVMDKTKPHNQHFNCYNYSWNFPLLRCWTFMLIVVLYGLQTTLKLHF